MVVSFVDDDVCGRWSGMEVGLELFGPVLGEMMYGTYLNVAENRFGREYNQVRVDSRGLLAYFCLIALFTKLVSTTTNAVIYIIRII